MIASLTRRRFIGVTAAASGLGLLPLGRAARAEGHLVSWNGTAMGAVAHLQIHHHDRAAAEALIGRAVAEVRRLETVFSLHREDSALARLNRRGVLVAPPPDLVALLEEARRIHDLTGGAFDPTVQPLWTLYRDHFSKRGASPDGPSSDDLRAALDLIGFGHVSFDRNRIAVAKRGMALTMNGIAQGYATDRVVALLRSAGIDRSLVDMGEPAALGFSPTGRPWRIGIADPNEPSVIAKTVELSDKAMATSGGYGYRFDPDGRFNHLLDPKTGRSPNLHRSVTTLHRRAAAADALSTAFSLMPLEEIASIVAALGETEVHLITAEGERRILKS